MAMLRLVLAVGLLLAAAAAAGAGSKGARSSSEKRGPSPAAEEEQEDAAAGDEQGLTAVMLARLQEPALQLCKQDNTTYHSGSHSSATRAERIAAAKHDLCTQNALSGFLTGAIPYLGIPAGLAASYSLQVRAACVVAAIRGYDVDEEEVQAMMNLAVLGETAAEALRHMASKAGAFGAKTAGQFSVSQLPKRAFKSINQKLFPLLGKHLITLGPQGLISLSKLVPVAGQVVGMAAGAAVDFIFCRRTVDFADQVVFKQLYRGQPELKEWLLERGFHEELDALLKEGFVHPNSGDTDLCAVEVSDFRTLGLALARAMKLRREIQSDLCGARGEL